MRRSQCMFCVHPSSGSFGAISRSINQLTKLRLTKLGISPNSTHMHAYQQVSLMKGTERGTPSKWYLPVSKSGRAGRLRYRAQSRLIRTNSRYSTTNTVAVVVPWTSHFDPAVWPLSHSVRFDIRSLPYSSSTAPPSSRGLATHAALTGRRGVTTHAIPKNDGHLR